LEQVRLEDDPTWLSYFTHARLAADATEIHRDLGQHRSAFAWNEQAEAMPTDQFTRAVGIRLSVLAGCHLQAGDLEQGLAVAERSRAVLEDVTSTRAAGYLRDVTIAMKDWHAEPRVAAFLGKAEGLRRP
ncbi:sporulation associated protein, partial [Streptomyces sp. NPDC058103]